MSITHVVALGGSLLRPEEAAARSMWMGQLRQLMVHLEGNGRRIGLVVGGGHPAREAIDLVKDSVNDLGRLDRIRISATRLNATLIQQMLLEIGCDVSPSIPENIEDARSMLEQHHIVVMGGTVPGHTTDTVAVKLAAVSHARHCIIATNVSHVFTKDPRKYDDAEALTEISLHELQNIVGEDVRMKPGSSAVVGPVAVQVAIDSGVDLAVLDGRDIRRLDDALEGKLFEGTIIKA